MLDVERVSNWIINQKRLGRLDDELLSQLVDRGMGCEEARSLLSVVVKEKLDEQDRLFRWQRKIKALLEALRLSSNVGCDALAVNHHSFLDDNVFRDNYFSQNRPVVITEMTANWSAQRNWNPEYFREKYSGCPIEFMSSKSGESFYKNNIDNKRLIATMSEFIDLVNNPLADNDIYLTANNQFFSQQPYQDLVNELGYLPGLGGNINPKTLTMWFGPPGTVTPLHHDHENAYLVQLYGRKKVLLAPALEIHLMANRVSTFSDIDPTSEDSLKSHPEFSKASVREIILEPGMALFIPVGWWHRVESLSVSISVSMPNFIFSNSYVMYEP